MEQKAVKGQWKKQMNWTIFWICAGFLIAFIIACLINKDATSHIVSTCFNFIGKYCGGFLQVMMVVFWVVAIGVALSKWGNIRIGGKDAKRDVKNVSWYAIITTTMLAGGGVFFAAGEPVTHFLALPQHFPNVESGTAEAVSYALAQSYFDWGFLVWGAASFCIPLMVYAKEIVGLPMRPSSMLYPVMGEKGVRGKSGKLLDGLALIGVAAGTIGPTGFLGLQISFALNSLWGIPNTATTQIIVILFAGVLFTIGAATGLNKGIDILSKATIYLSGILAVCVLMLGCGLFVIDSYIDSLGIYIQEFFNMAFSRGDVAWISGWTVFYEAWFLSFGPSMAVLIINLSKGRTLRQVLLSIAIMCPLLTNFWFGIFGGTAIGFEMQTPGLISTVLNSAGMPGVLLTVLQNMNGSIFLIPLALVLIVLFLVTTGAGVAYSMSVQVTDMPVPYAWVRTLFAVLLAVVAAVLVWIGGDNTMSTIQNFMVIGGVPLLIFYVILIPAVPKAAKALYRSKTHRIVTDDDGFDEAAAPVGDIQVGDIQVTDTVQPADAELLPLSRV